MEQLRPERGDGAVPSTRAAPRGRARRRADRPIYPVVDVPMAKIVAEKHHIEMVLTRWGVPSMDLPDVLQEVYFGAYRSLCAHYYRPSTHMDERKALIYWLTGIAWHHALKYRDSAQRRLVPIGLMFTLEGPRLIDQIMAREALGALRTLRVEYQEALACVAGGMDRSEVAAKMNIPSRTAAIWISKGRHELEAAITARNVQRARGAPRRAASRG